MATGLPAPLSRPTGPTAPAPSPIANFGGLDFATWGAGFPPDTNGDVGPMHYIQTVNTSVGVYSKSGGPPLAAFTFDTLLSMGSFGNLCDTDNLGDVVVVYDSFEDRWILSDFAFTFSGGGIASPPGSYECFAVSKTSDPVAGGWHFYSLHITDSLNDYPKLGIWPDGLYMSANHFGFAALSAFLNARVWALNKHQMYAGAANPQVVAFDAPKIADGGPAFTLLPSNARLQAGTPPAGTPNYFVQLYTFLDMVQLWKFSVDWGNVYASTFTGPFYSVAGSSWATPPGTVPSLGGNSLDTLGRLAMVQHQYVNLGGTESLWSTHTVRGSSTTHSAVRWYQIDVTGGTIGPAPTQAATHNPDTTNRFMPSLAVDRAGNMLIGYSASSASMKPAIRYAGRLVTDTLDSLPQTEIDLIAGGGTQLGSCGGSACTRWGDYSAMTLDPDGCTFWYTNEYYIVDGSDWQTRIGSTAFPSCTPVGSGGTVSGTVTRSAGGTAISGATVAFGARTTTTAVDGTYSFTSIPAGTYLDIRASAQGFDPVTSAPVVVADAATTTKDFALAAAPASGCLTDTSQADFSLGTPATCDLRATPGAVVLSNPNLDQQNVSLGGSGAGLSTTTWGGQTFKPTVTGKLARVDVNLFCGGGCTGTTPVLTLSVRTTGPGGLPTGADLATTTVPGFSSGASQFYSATFATPVTLVSGTTYALIIRPSSDPSAGFYSLTKSGSAGMGVNAYADGWLVLSTDSGASWFPPDTPPASTFTSDAGFRTYMKSTVSGDFVSSVKDANPTVGGTPNWTTLSWSGTTPPGTSLKFQAAASSSASGPFSFVGPDGTAATFYTAGGGSLSQFDGLRYLKYKAFLDTTDDTATPSLDDVTVCFDNDPPTAVSVRGFRAVRTRRGVAVSWRTATEVRIAGFNVFRSGRKVNRTLLPAKHSGRAAGASYRLVDVTKAGRARYRLQVVGLDGRRSWLRGGASA